MSSLTFCKGRCEKFRHNFDVDVTINGKVHPMVAALYAHVNRSAGPHASATDPTREGPK
jgi:hypothetical protein